MHPTPHPSPFTIEHPWRQAAMAFALSLALAGCQSEVALFVAAPPEVDPEPTPAAPTPGPQAPGDPPAPSPWADLDPGDLPELYFAVAHSPMDCCLDCDADTFAESDDLWWGGCPVSYSVVDLRGQVIASFELPNEEGGYLGHVEIKPAGHGQFLIIVERWGGTTEDTDEDGFWYGTPFEVWRADALTGGLDRILHADAVTGEAVVDGTGNRLSFGMPGSIWQVAMWPDEPETLAVWPGYGSCYSQGEGDIRIVPLTDAEAPVELIRIKDLIPEELRSANPRYPVSLDAFRAADGSRALTFGLSSEYCAYAEPWPLMAWSEGAGIAWNGELPVNAWPREATFAHHGEGHALHLASDNAGDWRWFVTGPEGTTEGPLGQMMWDTRPGPMLDAAGPTFVVLRNPGDTYQPRHSMDFVHQGEVVWRIDALRFGLAEQRVQIVDTILIPPVGG